MLFRAWNGQLTVIVIEKLNENAVSLQLINSHWKCEIRNFYEEIKFLNDVITGTLVIRRLSTYGDKRAET